MANSGYKNWLTLKKYVNGVATTETKTNDPADPDYIAPVLDTTACPTTSNSCPTLDTPISNISANVGGVDQTINLNNHFGDLDGDTLTYSATSSNTNSVTVSVASNILTLSFSSTAGSSIISVTASDGTCSANGSFSATVTEVSTACVTGLNQLLGLFSGATSDIACSPTLNTATFVIYGNGTSITNSTNFYSTIDGCTTMPAGFYAQADPSDPSTLVNWVQLNSSGAKIDSGLCDTSVPPPAPEPTQYTLLRKCTDNTTNYYTTEIINSGISYYSNGVCYITDIPIYDSAISGKTLVTGQQYAPNSNGPCDCDCYDQNCGGFWNLRICSTGELANQQIAYDANYDVGNVILAGNGICYEIDSYQANGIATQIVVSDGFNDCQECIDGQV